MAKQSHDPREDALREFCEQEDLDPDDREAPHVVAFNAGWVEGYGRALETVGEL